MNTPTDADLMRIGALARLAVATCREPGESHAHWYARATLGLRLEDLRAVAEHMQGVHKSVQSAQDVARENAEMLDEQRRKLDEIEMLLKVRQVSSFPIRRDCAPGIVRADWPGCFVFLGEDCDRSVYVGSHAMTIAAARELAAHILAAADELGAPRARTRA